MNTEFALQAFLYAYPTSAERVRAVEAMLRSKAGAQWRKQFGAWTTELVPLADLLPEVYADWRPLVRSAMRFVVERLSAARLAGKIVEQVELPPDTRAEERLLRLIAKVPGLQKVGQMVARNRRLPASFRRALCELENGIADVSVEEIRAIIERQLGPQLARYRVKIAPKILSEASVSAVVSFNWHNPQSGRREGGVFKVLKPGIPGCYAEDMRILQQLAAFVIRKRRGDQRRFASAAEMLTEIRLLLEREVDFRGEQRTLVEAGRAYGSTPGVRVPRLIEPLCTDTITALTVERGVKVTAAFTHRGGTRGLVAARLAVALLALPALALRDDAFFHADPHAGNLLYDRRSGELVILDWALTDRLTREQRRQLTMLVLMLMLRDAAGVFAAVERLRQHRAADDSEQARMIRAMVERWLERLAPGETPGPLEAMRLLDKIALAGVNLPSSLLMFRKAAFTLDGVLEDVAGERVKMDEVIARYAASHWVETGAALLWLLTPGDWLALEWSAIGFPLRRWHALGQLSATANAGALRTSEGA